MADSCFLSTLFANCLRFKAALTFSIPIPTKSQRARLGFRAHVVSANAPEIPDHRLISRIGSGSYGEVWLAQNDLGRYRAVKIVFRDRFKEDAPFEREFAGIRRFEPISRSHDALVDVLHVGDSRAKGYFYYVMEIADDVRLGQSIDPADYTPNTLAQQIVSRHRLPHQECIRLGLALSSGLAHLHESGLIHRDIKPSNVVFIGGKAKIVDLGLVAAIDDAASWVGTQGFIPPEGPGAAQGDIYSLGKTLYEAASGRDRQQFPELPTQLGDETSEREFLELNEILVKACHPSPNQRYRRMRDLFSELQVLADGQSLRRLRALERKIRFGKKVALTALAAVAVALLPIFHFVSLAKARREARQRQVGTQVANGSRDVSEGSYLTALPRFAEALQVELGNPGREAVHKLRIESALLFAPRLVHTIDLGGDLQNVEFSPDGSQLVATRYYERVHLLDVQTAAPIRASIENYSVRSSAFSPDGRTLVASAEDDYVLVVDVTTGQTRHAFRQKDRVMSVHFHPTLNRLLTACNDGQARIWDFGTGQVLAEFKGHSQGVLDAKFSPDGKHVLTTSKDFTARIWSADTAESLVTFNAHRDWVLHGNFHPTRDWVVTSSHDGSARVWRYPTGEPVGRPLLHRDSAANARFSPDGRYILTAGHDGSARLWDCLTWNPAARNPVLPHSAKVKDAAFAPDGRRIATACYDGTVRVWDLSEVGIPAQPLLGVFSGDGQRSAILTNSAVSIRSSGGPEIRSIALPSAPLEIALNFNGSFLLASFAEKESRNVKVWDISLPASPRGQFGVSATNTLASIEASADATLAAVKSSNKVIVANLKLNSVASFIHTNLVDSFAISPDNTLIATADQSGAHLWNLERPEKSRHFPLDRKPHSVRFSPDGSRLAVSTQDGFYTPCFAQIFDTATGSPLTPALQHEDGILAIAFSNAGDLLVTAGEDLCAKIWRASGAAGSQLVPPLLHNRQVRLAAFCVDDRFLATSDRIGMVRLFETAGGDPITPAFSGGPVRPKRLAVVGERLLSIDAFGIATSWTLPSANTDSTKLLRIIDYLTSRLKISPADLAALQSLPAFKSYLNVTSDQAAQWHLREAEESRAESNEAAVQFHLAAAQKIASPSTPLHAQINGLLTTRP